MPKESQTIAKRTETSLNSFIFQSKQFINLHVRYLKDEIVISRMPLIMSSLFVLYVVIVSLLAGKPAIHFSLATYIMIVGMILFSVLFYYLRKDTFQRPYSILFEFLPMLMILLSYDSLSVVAEELIFDRVNSKALYYTDKTLFSWMFGGKMPNEWFYQTFNSIAVDFIFGFTYMLHVFIPLLLGFIFILKRDLKSIRYTIFLFSISTLISFIIYLAFPTAAPWFVDNYGFIKPDPNLPYHSDITAGLGRLDDMLGVPIFATYYSFESNSFASFPSVHIVYAANAFVAAYFRWKKKSIPLGLLYVFAITFGAIYFYHHYIIDILAGYMITIISTLFANLYIKKTKSKKTENNEKAENN